MQKQHLLLAGIAGLFISGSALAANDGAYVGGQLGWGSSSIEQFSKTFDANGLAGGFNAGYQFNQNFALQTDYIKFSNETFNIGNGLGRLTVNSYSVDLVGKGILPLQQGFSLFGTLGAAYLHDSLSGAGSGSVSKVLPTFGAGVSYDISSSVSTEVSWSHIQKVGDTALRNTDFVGLGLTYHFS